MSSTGRRGARRAILGALAAGLAVLAGGLAGCGAPRPPDVLLVSLDTVRADHLSPYGYPRPTTPRLAALAAGGVVFDQAIAASTQTGPSHASFLTGLDPHRHGSEANGQPVGEEVTTLAERLAAGGYETAAFVSGLPLAASLSGQGRGFARYDDSFAGSRRPGSATVGRLVDWLAARESERPFFAFLHLYDAHGPYLPPPEYPFRFAPEGPARTLEHLPDYQLVHDGRGEPVLDLDDYVARYDTLIRYQDDLLGWLLERVDLGRTVVVVVSDHGETLGERYWVLDHGGQVFDEQARIPWIVAAPGLTPGRVGALVRGVDLFPTLLGLAGVPAPADLAERIDGRDLGPLLDRGGSPGPGYAFTTALPFAERHADRGYALTRERPILALRTPRWKLVSYPCAGEAPCVELYDLEGDPGERRNLQGDDPERRDRMLRVLEAWYGRPEGLLDPETLDPEVREHLRSLGYLGG